MAADATKLQSVNEMLSATGTARANSLGSSRLDVILAEGILDQVDREIQQQGWHWNTQYNQVFQNNVDNEVVLPLDIFEVRESTGRDGPMVSYPDFRSDLIKKGGKVYNALDDTFTFTGPVTLNVVRQLTFEDLPQYARDFITKSAAREFFEVSQRARSPIAEEKEARARGHFMAAEMRNQQPNFFLGPSTRWPFNNR